MGKINRITKYFPAVDNKKRGLAIQSSDQTGLTNQSEALRAPKAGCSAASAESSNCFASGRSELQVETSEFTFKKPLPKNSDHQRVSNLTTSSRYNANSVKKGLRHLHKSSQIQKSANSSQIQKSANSIPRGISNKGTVSNKTAPIPKSLSQNTNKLNDEVLILTTFSKIKKTRISRGCQTDISLVDTPRCPTKLNIYCPD